MDAMTYVGRIEAAVDDREELEALRAEVAADPSLRPDDARALDERIGGYLADLDDEAGVEPAEESAAG